MKKTYDLLPRTYGGFHAFEHGTFEESWNTGCSGKPFPADDYITVELPMCCYRYCKSDDGDRLREEIERIRKHQQAILDKEAAHDNP